MTKTRDTMKHYFVVDCKAFKNYEIPYDGHATLEEAKEELKPLEEKDGIDLWEIYKVTIEEIKDLNEKTSSS